MSNDQQPDEQDESKSMPEAAFENLATNPQSLGAPATGAPKHADPAKHTTPHSLGSPEKG